MPDEFVPQLPEAANPPTLLLPLLALVEELQQDPNPTPGPLDHIKMPDAPGMMQFVGDVAPEQWRDFLKRAWPKLLLWYAWMERTQAGPQRGTYRRACLRTASYAQSTPCC